MGQNMGQIANYGTMVGTDKIVNVLGMFCLEFKASMILFL